MYGMLAGAFGLYLLITGSIPIGRGPFFFSNSADLSPIMGRLAGALILTGLFIPAELIADWNGKPILLGAAIVVLLISLIASISGRAR